MSWILYRQMGARVRHRPFELSGGEQQRVAIARALANRPQVVIADEPTGELDSNTALAISELLRQIVAQEGVTVVIATHNQNLVARNPHPVMELGSGELRVETPGRKKG